MKFTEFFFRQGEGSQRPLSSACADTFPEGESRECGLRIRRLFEKMPECCSAAPHSSKASLCPPSPQGEGTKWLTIFAEENFVGKILCWQGEGLERGNIKTYPLSSAYVDTFPATVGFFALFSLRRKSEKGESKDKAADARHFPRRGKQGGSSAPTGKARE